MTSYTLSWSVYNGGKGWVARVTGLDPKYGLAREFVRAVSRHASRSGATGTAEYMLADGLYEVNERGGRHGLLVADGQARDIAQAELLAQLA